MGDFAVRVNLQRPLKVRLGLVQSSHLGHYHTDAIVRFGIIWLDPQDFGKLVCRPLKHAPLKQNQTKIVVCLHETGFETNSLLEMNKGLVNLPPLFQDHT